MLQRLQIVKNPVSTDNIRGEVEFDHVRFGYKEDQVIIRDFCAKVKPGQKVAIVGPTGAGKTTMVKLLMRFYDVNSGEIRIDGHNIKDFNRRELRDAFGMVLQDTWLYKDTIMENIRYGKLEASDEEVIAAAKAALANGIPVVLGNDVGCPWITQYDFWRELFYFHKYVGVSNSFALYTATLNSAKLAGIGAVTGSIESGKCADMIVTRDNPLEDLRALRNVDMVIARGNIYDNPKVKVRKNVAYELDKYLNV